MGQEALAGGAGKKERVDHPTQKPINLGDTLIKAALNKKDFYVGYGFQLNINEASEFNTNGTHLLTLGYNFDTY